MMKIKLKRGVILKGVMYKAGEVIEVDDLDGYAFTWLKSNGYITQRQEVNSADEVDDGLVVTEGLPPLDDIQPPKKGKNKNV